MRAILMLVRQINEGRCEVERQSTRAVTRNGNRKTQALVADVCTPDSPMESCMVSTEGACAAHDTYGRLRDHGHAAGMV